MSRSDYHLSGNPMVGPTVRQERAMDVAQRVNRITGRTPSDPRYCRMQDVLARIDARLGIYGGADR